MGKNGRLRGVYGKPIARKVGQSLPLSQAQLQFVGETVVESIRREIAKDTAKASAFRSPGQPVPIPRTRRFAESFSFRIRGESTLEFISDWPTAEAHTSKEPSRQFPMTWLTRPKVPHARIALANGEVVVRTSPLKSNMWIHPGFLRYTFLERGVRKGRKEAMEALLPDLLGELLGTHDLFGG
jgi:hypothetical protein